MRTLLIMLLFCGTVLPGFAQSPEPARPDTAPPPAQKADDDAKPEAFPDNKPQPPNSTVVRYYGHAFLYMITSSGVRIAFNPYPKDERIGYQFPSGLPVDMVLISAESVDMSSNEGFTGLPQVFRSLTGVGSNNANGIQFRGVATYRDGPDARYPRSNTAYVMELDGLVFGNMGAIGQVLNKNQLKEIGHVDVLFLPVGNQVISVADLWKIVEQTGAKWVVPVMYRTEKSPFVEFRKLEDFLSAPESAKYPKVKLDGNEYTFDAKHLPKTPTLLIYKLP